MNKKIVYILSTVVLIVILLSVILNFFKPKYRNVFEEIYHDEYHHATTSFLRTTATLNSIKDIEENKTRGLFYGIVSEEYKKETLPTNITAIVYNFFYPDNQLTNGNVSITINYKFTSSDTLQISYLYEHDSNLLKRQLQVFSDSFEKEYLIEQYFEENKLNFEDYCEIGDKLLQEKLIPDWLSVYPSRFTKDNWGDVQIVELQKLE